MYGVHDFFGRFDSDTSVGFPTASWTAAAEQDAWPVQDAWPLQDPAQRDIPRRQPQGHRRRARHSAAGSTKPWGPLFGALTALVATAVILTFWISSSGSLRNVAASHTSQEMARIWPVVAYGPWIVACVSSLLGAFDQRRITHSWVFVVLFSGAAALMCSRNSFGIPPDMVAAGLPPIAAAISFHQFLDHVAIIRSISSRRSGGF